MHGTVYNREQSINRQPTESGPTQERYHSEITRVCLP